VKTGVRRLKELLRTTNEKLKQEILQREKVSGEKETLIQELREALGKVKTLSGFIPICASCKKVRDDHGYWEKHTEVEFSHSLCPECTRKLYPDLLLEERTDDSPSR
jgi:hypothetical protein